MKVGSWTTVPRLRVLMWTIMAAMLSVGAAGSRTQARMDFANSKQLDDLSSPTRTWAYAISTEPGIGGVPGRLDSSNRGKEAGAGVFTKQSFDLRRQQVTISVCVQAQAGGAGVARIFVGLADSPDTNLATGDGKLGVRLFKNDKPKHPATPWVFQLVNGIATRDIGEHLSLMEGAWYRLSITFSLSEDERNLNFSASLAELGADGLHPTSVTRSEEGTTQLLAAYKLNGLSAALLGQNNNGGATAFDDWTMDAAVQPGAATESTQPLTEVTFPPAPLHADQIAPPDTLFGVCGHFMHTDLFYKPGTFTTYWRLEYTLPFLLNANMGWVREPLYQPWFDDPSNPKAMANRQVIENYLDLYQRHGVKVMLVAMAVNDGDPHAGQREAYFQWLAGLAATHPCVRVVEMHNEPNLKFFWHGSVEDYVRIYREGAKILRARNPKLTIAVGAVSSLWWKPGIDWLGKAIELGVLDFADAVSMHPYNNRAPPEADPNYEQGSMRDGDQNERAIEAFAAWLRDRSKGRPLRLYFTELGYSSGTQGMNSVGGEEAQADYLSRLMLIYFDLRLRGVPLDGVFWYDLKNDGTKPDAGESNFGLLTQDTARVKPAYDAYRRIAGAFSDPARYERASARVTSTNHADAVKHFAWLRKSDGALVIPFWRLEQRQADDVDFATELRITLPDATPRRVVLHSLAEQAPREIGYVTDPKSPLEMTAAVWVTGRAAWLEVLPVGK